MRPNSILPEFKHVGDQIVNRYKQAGFRVSQTTETMLVRLDALHCPEFILAGYHGGWGQWCQRILAVYYVHCEDMMGDKAIDEIQIRYADPEFIQKLDRFICKSVMIYWDNLQGAIRHDEFAPMHYSTVQEIEYAIKNMKAMINENSDDH